MRSKILVTAQFTIVFAIAVTGRLPLSTLPLFLFLAGALLGAVAIITMRLDNLRIFPEPKKDIRLVTSGPYRYIRHPMYTSLLILMAAWLAETRDPLQIGLWIIMSIVLVMKMQIEERILPLVLPEYRHYQERTWKIVPYIY